MSQHSKSLISLAVVLCMLLSLPGRAWAVTQEEINSARARRDAISAQRREKQAVVDALAQEQAGVLERKAAMDERSAYTQEQICLTREEIELYRERIEEKAKEVAAAKQLENEQLERYRVRVRVMEEEGKLNVLSLVLHTENPREFLTALDDMAEIMRYDRALEDAYIAARKHTEAVRADYEAAERQLQERRDALESEEAELRGEIEEASALIRTLQSDLESGRADVEAITAAEWAADQELQHLIQDLER